MTDPELPVFARPAVLVFNKTNGFRHGAAIAAADQTFSELAEANGWDVYVTDNAAVHTRDSLHKFRLVVWNNVSGDVLCVDQRQALRQWLEAGGAWLGVHASGGDLSYDWDWYVDEVIGTQFHGHTLEPQFQDAELLVTDASEPMTAHLQSSWRIPAEEWYAFASNPREKGYEILLTLDKNSYVTKGELAPGWIDNMPGEHPQVWRHHLREGRVFYSAIGHQAETYRLPEYRELLNHAMRWGMRQ
ncbi:Uncharacterised protein [Halioglobus japonicus]|nr:Uncharacterised protein [Halioglobus japonicus]